MAPVLYCSQLSSLPHRDPHPAPVHLHRQAPQLGELQAPASLFCSGQSPSHSMTSSLSVSHRKPWASCLNTDFSHANKVPPALKAQALQMNADPLQWHCTSRDLLYVGSVCLLRRDVLSSWPPLMCADGDREMWANPAILYWGFRAGQAFAICSCGNAWVCSQPTLRQQQQQPRYWGFFKRVFEISHPFLLYTITH